MTHYQMQLDSVIEVNGSIDFRSFGDEVTVAITRTPQVSASVFKPGAHLLVVDDNRGTVPVTVPGIGNDNVHKGDVIVALDNDNDGLVDSWELIPLVSAATNRPLVHVEQTAGVGPIGGGTATGTGSPVAWNATERQAAVAKGAGVFVDVQIPTQTVPGYLGLVEVYANGQTNVHWSEVLPVTLAAYFATHTAHGTQVVDDPSNITRGDQVGVVFDGVNLSLMDKDGLLGTATHALSTADAARITAQDVPGPVTGQHDDVYINEADGTSWIHDGATWVMMGSHGGTWEVIEHYSTPQPSGHIWDVIIDPKYKRVGFRSRSSTPVWR